MFKEDFEAERKSRAEAFGKMDDLKQEYERCIEKMKKEGTGRRAKLEELLLKEQQQFHEYLEEVKSDLAAKATQVKK